MNLLKEMNEREESQNDNWSKGSVKSRKGPVPPLVDDPKQEKRILEALK